MPRSAGYATKTRQLILEYLITNRAHTVSVSDILAYLASEHSEDTPNITTVYRYLDKLCAEHRVMKYIADKGEKAVYQFVEDGQSCAQHLHLKCNRCGKVLHLDCGFMDDLRAHLTNAHSFQLSCEGSMLYGICKQCSEHETNEKTNCCCTTTL